MQVLKAKRRIRNRPEQGFQIAVCEFLDLALLPAVEWTHIPSGGYRRPVEAAVFKEMGHKPGWPDLLFVCRGQAFGIELKAPGEKLNINQVCRHALLRAAGMRIETCESVEEVRIRLAEWGLPMRQVSPESRRW